MFKILSAAVVLGLVIVLLAGQTASGRGGGGGGGHAMGGGGFGGGSFQGAASAMGRPSFNHAPSFNSPSTDANFSRSNLTPGNRPNINQLPAFGQGLNSIQRGMIDNRTIGGNTNQFNINRTSNFNRTNYANWNHGNWYHGNWNWNHPWHGGPVTWWTAGFMTGWAASTAPWAWGYWSYYNPYYIAPVVVGDTTIDYSLPIVTAYRPENATEDQAANASDQAKQMLDSARREFAQGNYDDALSLTDQAIAKMPNDTVLHEFRGLALFALQRYQESAAAVYAVLSVGPGWDWTTLSSLYPKVDAYTGQLRALERYVEQNPKSADGHFLLAYHYLTMGHTNAAVGELKDVVSLNPKDQLSAQLLSSLTTPDAPQPKTAAPVASSKPVNAAALAGIWNSTRPDGATIKLVLTTDGNFTWKFTQKDKSQEFSGPFTVADNLLILKQDSNPVMVGQVTQFVGNSFNFKLAGDNPNDPGLNFSK
jgi:tetratricopeptide (TPR) repeat protein